MLHEFVAQLSLAGFVLLVTLFASRYFGKASMRPQLRALQEEVEAAQARERAFRHDASEANRRAERAETTSRELERSIAELPEIAQRLSATRNLRDIPACALELVQEVFDPRFSVFYTCVRGNLVAVATSGQSGIATGHRLQTGSGIVGWTAVKQMPVTPESVAHESNLVRGRHLSEGMPEAGFSMCLPVLRGNETVGVILVGPSQRSLPRATDLGRTIALMTSVAISSAVVLREQEHLAQTDGLTGLFNKRHILEHIEQALHADERRGRSYSIFLFDIDHFKHYNDTHGHQPGDDLLRSVAALLKSNLRESEYVGRYGGEEFLLAMADVDKDQALMAAERIRSTIAAHPFRFADQQPLGRLSVSGGVATWPADGPDLPALIRAADDALYKAKRAGRDKVFGYEPLDLRGAEEIDLVTGPIVELGEADEAEPKPDPVEPEPIE